MDGFCWDLVELMVLVVFDLIRYGIKLHDSRIFDEIIDLRELEKIVE